jgi:23S rRNA (pseudouridine1915-N3)-methyltransferase
MKVNIISVGKLKEKYFADAAEEYSKRLTRYCHLNRITVQDIKIPDNASHLTCEKILTDEGREILKRIKKETVIALCIEGRTMSSEELAQTLENTALREGEITFVTGGSLGLSKEVKERAAILLSMSKMTFPHQLAQIMLLEQIYRGYKINHNETYHK